MEAGWVLSGKDHAQTQFEADQNDTSDFGEKNFTSGNNQEDLDFKKIQDCKQQDGSLEVTEAVSSLSRKGRHSEMDQNDTSGLEKKSVLDGNNQKSLEENAVAENSQNLLLPSKQVQESQQWVVDLSREHASVLPLDDLKQSSSNSGIPASVECGVGKGLSISGKDELRHTQPVDQVKDGNLIAEGSYLPREMSGSSEKTQMANVMETDCVTEEVRISNESKTDSMAPCIGSNMLKSDFLKDSQPSPILSSSEASNKLNTKSETILPSRSNEDDTGFQNDMNLFLDPSNQEWSDLDFGGGEATHISSDMEGWQQFDNEENITGADSIQNTDRRGLWWECLLDDGLESAHGNDAANHLHHASPPAFKENEAELQSLGNPFIEEIERMRSSSETDGFVCREEFPDKLSRVFEETPHLKKELTQETALCDPPLGNEVRTEEQKNTFRPRAENEKKNKLHLQSSSSLDFVEPFEAPSFMSLVDPKSHALFEASMPTYQANQSRYRHERGEEDWVANFDLVAPSAQEINRSISMPRSGSDVPDQRPGQSLSFTSNRGLSKKENESPSVHRSLSGLLPSKLSPIIQKVVGKGRNTPAAANGASNTVQEVTSPKSSDKKPTSGSFLTRCICW